MSGVPAHCPHCGLLFISNAFQMVGATNVTFSNCRVSCPRCSGMASVIDGTFDFVGNAIKVKKLPEKSLEIIRALQNALSSANSGVDHNEVICELGRSSPEFAAAAHEIVKKSGVAGFVFFLLYLLTSCSNLDQKLDWNELVDQAHVYWTGADPYPHHDGRVQDQKEIEQHPQVSRQQRRHQERQSQKAKKLPVPAQKSKSVNKKS